MSRGMSRHVDLMQYYTIIWTRLADLYGLALRLSHLCSTSEDEYRTLFLIFSFDFLSCTSWCVNLGTFCGRTSDNWVSKNTGTDSIKAHYTFNYLIAYALLSINRSCLGRQNLSFFLMDKPTWRTESALWEGKRAILKLRKDGKSESIYQALGISSTIWNDALYVNLTRNAFRLFERNFIML